MGAKLSSETKEVINFSSEVQAGLDPQKRTRRKAVTVGIAIWDANDGDTSGKVQRGGIPEASEHGEQLGGMTRDYNLGRVFLLLNFRTTPIPCLFTHPKGFPFIT